MSVGPATPILPPQQGPPIEGGGGVPPGYDSPPYESALLAIIALSQGVTGP